jgi:hypothetical protein
MYATANIMCNMRTFQYYNEIHGYVVHAHRSEGGMGFYFRLGLVSTYFMIIIIIIKTGRK